MKKVHFALLIGVPVFILAVYFSYWKYEYLTHATPEKAEAIAASAIADPIIESVKYAKGVVLITHSAANDSFTAWYMTKNSWGWHVGEVGYTAAGYSPQNQNVSFAAFSNGGETFVWGTHETPMKEIVYHHGGKTYTTTVGKSPVWHMILPFTQHVFPYNEWTMIRPDGQTDPLFK